MLKKKEGIMGKKKRKSHALRGIIAIGGIVCAAIVSNRVRENNPNGIKDSNNDGIVDAKDYAEEFKKAAKETYDATKEYAKEKAPIVKEKASKAYAKAKEYAKDKAPIVKEKASEVIENVKEKIKED